MKNYTSSIPEEDFIYESLLTNLSMNINISNQNQLSPNIKEKISISNFFQ